MVQAEGPPSPKKLPAYSGPRIDAQRPPSPPIGLESFTSGILGPSGCDLTIHNLKDVGGFPSRVVEETVSRLMRENENLAEVPVQVQYRNKTDCFCTLKLKAEVSVLDTSPRPDLLERWIEPLRQVDPDWMVDWSATAQNKERRLWIGLSGAKVNVDKSTMDRTQKELGTLGYPTSGMFYMNGSGIVVAVMSTLSIANKLLAKRTILLRSLSKESMSISGFRVIQPRWAFELAITGIDNYDPTICYSLDLYFSSHFRDEEGETLWHSSRVVDGVYTFLMKSWNATVSVLRDKGFTDYIHDSPLLMSPRLLYDINTNGKWTENLSRQIRNASTAVGADMGNLQKEMESLRKEMRAGFTAADQRFAAIGDNLSMVTSTLATLSAQVQNQGHALIAHRNQSLLLEQRIHIEMKISRLIERMDYANTLERADLKQQISVLEYQKEELDAQSSRYSSTMMGLLGAHPSHQLPPPPTHPHSQSHSQRSSTPIHASSPIPSRATTPDPDRPFTQEMSQNQSVIPSSQSSEILVTPTKRPAPQHVDLLPANEESPKKRKAGPARASANRTQLGITTRRMVRAEATTSAALEVGREDQEMDMVLDNESSLTQ